ncbi:MAG TPA: FapA family protein [Bordetella sp.]|nr:FapA family protein [Bordetella sp.]
MGNEAVVVQLALDPGTHVLSATYARPGGQAPSLGWDDLSVAVQARGWTPLALDHRRATAFLRQCRDADAPVTAAVGEVLDSTLRIDIEPDRMCALLTVTAARGGHAVTLGDIYAALAAQDIVAGIDNDAIHHVLQRGHCVAMPVARGTPARPGTPTRFESLIKNPLDRAHDDAAPVDYRELGNLVLVEPGAELVRRVPAEQGVPGVDVLGQPVPPDPVPDLPFAARLGGVAADERDPGLLRASVAGIPMLLPQGAQVSPIAEVDAVDLDSGNIDFDGTLHVRGDVTNGMTVRVSGDVIVAGTVEAALIQAGGSLTVSGGIIGMAESAPGKHAAGLRTAHVQCEGSVKARFIAHAVVSAGQQVAVEREIRQSRILAGHSVLVGPPGSQHGVVTGGEICALLSVRAGTLGSMAAVPTLVRVGLDPHAAARRATLKAQRHRLDKEKAKLEKLLGFLQQHPEKTAGDLGARVRDTYARTRADLQDLDHQETELESRLQPLQSAQITVARRYHGGVTLQVAVKVTTLLEDQPGGKACLEAGQLVIV